MTTVEVLTKAKELIADPAKWCQLEQALGPDGEECLPTHVEAVKWCATGAVYKTYMDGFCWAVDELDVAAFEMYGMDVIDVNDRIGHEAVMKCFDRAIELAQEAGDGKATD